MQFDGLQACMPVYLWQKQRDIIHHHNASVVSLFAFWGFLCLEFTQTVDGMRGSSSNTTEISDDSKNTTVSTTKLSNASNITPYVLCLA